MKRKDVQKNSLAKKVKKNSDEDIPELNEQPVDDPNTNRLLIDALTVYTRRTWGTSINLMLTKKQFKR